MGSGSKALKAGSKDSSKGSFSLALPETECKLVILAGFRKNSATLPK